MSQKCPIKCIAILAPDESLLFIHKSTGDPSDLELDGIVYCSTLNNKVSRTGLGRNEKFSIIYDNNNYMVYGYRAPLSYKIIIVIPHVQNPNENSLKNICDMTKDLLFDAILDPFYSPFSPTNNLKAKISNLMHQQGITSTN